MNLQTTLRTVQDWYQHNVRAAGMLVLAIVLLGTVAFIYRPKSREMVILHRQDNARNLLVFNLGDDYMLKSIEISEVDENGEAMDPLWRLKPGMPENADPEREKLVPIDTFRYPQRIRGMVHDTEGRPPKLKIGVPYRLKIIAKGGRAEYDFEIKPPTDRPRG